MRGALVWAMASMLAGGCIAPDEREAGGNRLPSEPAPAGGVNVTGCNGAGIAFLAPLARIRPLVPSQFDLQQPLPGFGVVLYDGLRCDKLAVGGVDKGRIAIAYVLVPVVAPPQIAPPVGVAGQFLVRVQTDNAVLHDVLGTLGIEAPTVTVDVQVAPALMGYELLATKIGDSNTVHTEFECIPSNGLESENFAVRWFYGGAGKYLDVDVKSRESDSDGPAEARLGEKSPIYPVVEPGRAAEGLAKRIADRSETWAP